MNNFCGRPMLLISKKQLANLYMLKVQGVTLANMIRNNKLEISNTKLSKALQHYSMYVNASQENKNTIHDSLFPEWLIADFQTQNSKEWVYVGTFPLGKWIKKEN